MKEDKKNPKIRFKGFNEEWEQLRFEQFAKYRNGKAHENDISEDGKYIVVNSKFCSTDGEVKKYSNNQIEPLYKNEIAFVLSDVPNGRALARTFLVDKNDKYTLNQRIAGITPLENVNPYYLYILMNRNKYFLQFDDGAKQTNLSTSDVCNYVDMFPSKNEQEKIGNMFKKMDKLILLNQSKYNKLINLKRTMLCKLFPQKTSPIPEIRFKGFNSNFEQFRLDELVDFYRGHGLSWNDIVDKGDNKCILYGNLYTDYGMIIKDVIRSTNNSKDDYFLSKTGDVLIPSSDTTPTGLARASAINLDGIILGGDINVLRPKTINGPYLSFSINNYRDELIKRIKGTTVRHLNISDISDMNIKISTDKLEQEKVSNLLIKIDELIILYQSKLEKLNNIRKSMLDKMLV